MFCLFFVINPENLNFASRFGFKVNPLGVYLPGPRACKSKGPDYCGLPRSLRVPVFFFGLFVVIKPANPYFASRVGFEVICEPLGPGVYPLATRVPPEHFSEVRGEPVQLEVSPPNRIHPVQLEFCFQIELSQLNTNFPQNLELSRFDSCFFKQYEFSLLNPIFFKIQVQTAELIFFCLNVGAAG